VGLDRRRDSVRVSGCGIDGWICAAPQPRGGSWSKDGVIIFSPTPSSGIFRVSAAGGAAVPLTKVDFSQHEDSHRWPQFLPDGRHFIYLARTVDRSSSKIQLGSDFLPAATGLSRFSFPRISPNGKWIAYSSFESGRAELYISLFPSGTGKWQVSTNGGRDSIWRLDGKELFFTTPFEDSLMSAEIFDQNGDPVIGKVRPLFRIRVASSPHGTFDVSPDGKRFLINTVLPPPAPEPITLVVNWEAELNKRR
jgi:WD40-like Beta Propeller Repeat